MSKAAISLLNVIFSAMLTVADPNPWPQHKLWATITKAIKSMKSGKALGIDGTQAELLKADLTTATDAMYNFFNAIWKKSQMTG